MEEKYKDRMFIDMGEFQSKILEHVVSEEFNKQFGSTQFSTYEDTKGYRQAMMHGMIMASLMASQCELFYVREKLEIENDESKRKEFADEIYRFFCKKQNWDTFKDQWLENGECYWLKQKIDSILKEFENRSR